MRKLYAGLCALLLIAVIAQFYFAAVGAFAKPQRDDSFALHDLTGMMIIPVVSLLATIAAAVARAPGRQVGLTLAPLGLVVVQVLIVTLGRAFGAEGGDTTTPLGLAILGLHAVNGLFILGVASIVLRRARAFATAPEHPVAAMVSA
jgi:hypothetical protein